MTENQNKMDPQTILKKQAGEKAAEYVKDGMIVGLGTGSTVEWTIKKIGEMVKDGLDVLGIPTSIRSERLAKELNIPLSTLLEHPEIDLTIDGADEVDPNLNLIKGLGGALTREKIVASCSGMEIIVVDESKLVDVLGRKSPVPVEVLPFAWNTSKVFLKKLGSQPIARMEGSEVYITDNGNYILDCRFDNIVNPMALDQQINNIPGVLENGLFVNLTHVVIVASPGGIKVLQK